MATNPLKKMKRAELLQIIEMLQKTNEELTAENAELKEKLEQRALTIEESGSIAEAALRLTGIFEEAQRAADIYLESIKQKRTKSHKNKK